MNTFENDDIIRELREGFIAHSAYVIDKVWWDEFWSKLTLSDGVPDVGAIDNSGLM